MTNDPIPVAAPVESASTERVQSPYVGLNPYTIADTEFFFGRDKDTEIITANLAAARLTLLYGASGVGKTSVLQAGVISGLNALARREIKTSGVPEYIVVYFKSWRDEPIAELLKTTADSIRATLPALELAPRTMLHETLQTWSQQTGAKLLFILDQFEEYFLYHPNEEGEGTFAYEFPRTLKQPALRASFLLSFREDSLARLDRFKGYIPNLFKNILRLKHLDLDAGRDAIRKPIDKFNEMRPADVPEVKIEPALVETVLEQVRVGRVVIGEMGRGGLTQDNADLEIEAPYLQLVLTRLWERERAAGSNVLHLATLHALGGAEEIVCAHLQHAIDDLSPAEQAIAASVFDRLVTPSGMKIAQTTRDLARNAHVSEQELNQVLERLASGQNRILRPVAPAPDQPNVPRYEIFHDVLSGAILEWRTRYEKEQEEQKLQAELARERAEQERQHTLEMERQRGRIFRIAAFSLALLLLLAIIAAFFALQQRQDAVASRFVAETKVAVAQTQAANAQSIANSVLTSVPRESPGVAQTQAAFAGTQAAIAQSTAVQASTSAAQQSGTSIATDVAVQGTAQAAATAAALALARQRTAEANAVAAGTAQAVRETAQSASTSAAQILSSPTAAAQQTIDALSAEQTRAAAAQETTAALYAAQTAAAAQNGNRVRYWIECDADGNARIYVYTDPYPWPYPDNGGEVRVYSNFSPAGEGPMNTFDIQPKIVNPHGSRNVNSIDYRITLRFGDGYQETAYLYYRWPSGCGPTKSGQSTVPKTVVISTLASTSASTLTPFPATVQLTYLSKCIPSNIITTIQPTSPYELVINGTATTEDPFSDDPHSAFGRFDLSLKHAEQDETAYSTIQSSRIFAENTRLASWNWGEARFNSGDTIHARLRVVRRDGNYTNDCVAEFIIPDIPTGQSFPTAEQPANSPTQSSDKSNQGGSKTTSVPQPTPQPTTQPTEKPTKPPSPGG